MTLPPHPPTRRSPWPRDTARLLVVIFIGGCLGTATRAGFDAIWPAPLSISSTMVVNVLGATALGFLSTFMATRSRTPWWFAGVTTGFFGSFTTYSAFALATAHAFVPDPGEPAATLTHEALSLTIGLGILLVSFTGALIGWTIGRFLGLRGRRTPQ